MESTKTAPENGDLIHEIKKRFSEVRCGEVLQLLSTMANPVRFHILCALRIQPFTVTELVDIAEGNVSNVSQQLKMMWLSGYLEKEKSGKQVLYRLKDDRIKELIASLEDLYPEDPEDECVCED